MITVVDYGVGNIGAILNMLDYLGLDAQATGDARTIERADKLVLPGVGAFDKAMGTLRERRLVEPLNTAVLDRKVPVIGVCLGMQLLARRSEEGRDAGLGWLPADVRRIALPAGSPLKVPHIGWMEVRPTRTSLLFGAGSTAERFYFDHSYHVVCDHEEHQAAVIDYGSPLCCAVAMDNVFGAQFHPEKSHRFGMRLFTAFGKL